MDKIYNHKIVEEKIYKEWEEKGFFKPEINEKGKPYSIILPPPNANAPLHFGHAMYVVEDILIRYHRMLGDKTLWLPGADHAGFETQFVFEKKLQAEGKSRFDYTREELYKMIFDFTKQNRPIMEGQLKRLGFSLDWSRKKFTIDPDIVEIVYDTFKKLWEKNLVYRAKRLVNYCTYDGTSFSDLEVIYEEKQNPLYYIKYGPLVLATTRPETKFGDTAVAVHPNDKRYQKYIGKEIEIETVLGKAKIKVIADNSVDPEFGTGVVKITPAHDFNDFEVGQRHNLPMVQVIGFDGKMSEKAGKFAGMYARQARKAIIEEMQQKGLVEKIDENYTHRIGLCYKCKNPIEPLPLEQWFVKTKPLAKPAIEAVKKGKIKIYPNSFENRYMQFLENIRDWNISRQVVWGIRIPVWYCGGLKKVNYSKMGFHEEVVPQVFDGKSKTYRLTKYDFKEGDKVLFENTQEKKLFGYGIIEKIEETTVEKIDYKDKTHYVTYKNLDELIKAFKNRNPDKEVSPKSKAYLYEYRFFPFDKENTKDGCGQVIVSVEKPEKCPVCQGTDLYEETDTFDTWFSSSQWPYATLKTTKGMEFYPTTVMETGYDILPWWVARMVMLGLFIDSKTVPFENVALHGLVKDPLGKKMSKSKGNVVNPLEVVDQYGADAVRFALVYGTAFGNDQSLSYPKLQAMRNFTNKLWNMGRFIDMQFNSDSFKGKELAFYEKEMDKNLSKEDLDIVEETNKLIKDVTASIDSYRFHDGASQLYDFIWHRVADIYIEQIKERLKEGDESALIVLRHVWINCIKLLHPFMPFITEELFKKILRKKNDELIISYWPKA
jgi:valyl-tRNA synthetase